MQPKDNDATSSEKPVQPEIEIFLCYAREDEILLRGLEKQLRVLQRQGMINLWHDRNISAGAEWEQEIARHLHIARIILLLVSPDFMDSDYCYGIEMQQAMVRHTSGEACVIPIILRPVYWQRAPFGKLQALPKDAQPVISPFWHSQDEAFFSVAEGIRQAVEEQISLQQNIKEVKRRGNLDKATNALQKLQLTCMLMEYGIDIEMKRDKEIGIGMMEDYEKLRGVLLKEIEEHYLIFSLEEITASYECTGFYQKMYSQLSDTALTINRKYFPMPPRPQGSAFSCTEQACREAALNMLRKSFPSLYNIVRQPEQEIKAPIDNRFDKFSERYRKALALSQEEAQRLQHQEIGSEHLLLGLIHEGEGIAFRILTGFGVELSIIRAAIEARVGRGEHPTSGELSLTSDAKKAILLSVNEARRLNHSYIGTGHLLLGLILLGEGIAIDVLVSRGVDLEEAQVLTVDLIR